jgi:hypothetical protein
MRFILTGGSLILLCCSCTVALEGGPIYRDLVFLGEKEEVCFSLLSVEISGFNPFLEEEARDLFLKDFSLFSKRECAGRGGARVRIQHLAVRYFPDTYGYPPPQARDAFPSPSFLRVELVGEFVIEACSADEEPVTLPFWEKGWIPYSADPYRNEESALASLRELAGQAMRTLLLKVQERSCKSTFALPAS